MSDEKVSRKRSRASLEPLRITIKNDLAERDYVRIIQIEPVSNELLLSEFLQHFINDYNTIIGVHRVADYTARIIGNVIFMYLTSAREYRKLLSTRRMMIDGRTVNIKDPDLISGCARYIIPFAVETESNISNAPIPMSLFGFRTLPTITTFYVIEVLRELELQHTTTGFRLAYCERLQTTRNFGFATFISRQVALQLNERQFYVLTDRIQAKLPNATPVLIHKSKSYLLRNGRCDLSDAIREANWLHVNLADPTVPLHSIIQELEPGPSGIANKNNKNNNCSPIRPPEVSDNNSSVRDIELLSGIERNSLQHDSNNKSKFNESDELSLGEDYDMDEEGELHTEKKQRK